MVQELLVRTSIMRNLLLASFLFLSLAACVANDERNDDVGVIGQRTGKPDPALDALVDKLTALSDAGKHDMSVDTLLAQLTALSDARGHDARVDALIDRLADLSAGKPDIQVDVVIAELVAISD